MKSLRSRKKLRIRPVSFTLWMPLFIGSIVLLVLGGVARFLLQVDVQYKLKNFFVLRKFPDANRYVPQPTVQYAYSTESSSSTYQVQYVYRLNTKDQTLRELYSRARASWPSNAVLAAGNLIISDGKSVFRLEETSGNITTYMSDMSKPAHLHVLSSTDDGVYVARTAEGGERIQPYAISAVDVANRTSRFLFEFEPGTYEVPHTLIVSDPYYLVVGGGDGCGGKQKIFVLESGKQRVVAEFGEGCVEGPRYIGVMNDTSKVLAAATLKPEEGENGPRFCKYDVLYSYELATGKVQPIMDLKTMKGCIRDMTYDRITNLMIIVTEDSMHIVDVSRALIIRTLVKPDGAYNFAQYGDKLAAYVSGPNDKHIAVIDISSGDVLNVPWDFRLGRFPSFVGRDGDDILISTLESRSE